MLTSVIKKNIIINPNQDTVLKAKNKKNSHMNSAENMTKNYGVPDPKHL